jgi:hypothetical protein
MIIKKKDEYHKTTDCMEALEVGVCLTPIVMIARTKPSARAGAEKIRKTGQTKKRGSPETAQEITPLVNNPTEYVRKNSLKAAQKKMKKCSRPSVTKRFRYR